MNFSNLHNISKHAIYLNEAFEAAQLLVGYMLDEYRRTHGFGVAAIASSGTPIRTASRTQSQLQRHVRLFRSTQMRLLSLEKRITNITNLVR